MGTKGQSPVRRSLNHYYDGDVIVKKVRCLVHEHYVNNQSQKPDINCKAGLKMYLFIQQEFLFTAVIPSGYIFLSPLRSSLLHAESFFWSTAASSG